LKFYPFAATPRWNYLFDAFPVQEIRSFVPQPTCSACGTKDQMRPIARIGGAAIEDALSLVCCSVCGHVTYDKLPTMQWIDHYYSDVWDRDRRGTKAPVIKVDDPTFPPWGFPWTHFRDLKVPTTARVLDFGCGFGHGLHHLKKQGYTDTWGVEMGTHRVETASRYFPGRVRQGSLDRAQEIAAEAGPFDVVILHHVLEHILAPFDVIRGLTKIVSPKGLIVVAVPEIFSESPLMLPLYFPHLHHFNTTSLFRLFKRAGLKSARWRASQPQLAMAGSVDPSWVVPPEYSAEEPSMTAEGVDAIGRYVAGPWRSAAERTQEGNLSFMCHVNPAYEPNVATGFQTLSDSVGLYLRLGKRTVFPLMDRSPVKRGYSGFIRLAGLLFGSQAPISREIVGARRAVGGEPNIPWLTLPNGDVPVLVK
jgi:2-polyprenyl-3-methyl-5-hydroxy-6-metoxy-1,4-benzoquinol methylase